MTTIEAPVDEAREVKVERAFSDRLYRAVALAAGSVTLIVIVLIFVFLVVRSWPAIAGSASSTS